MVIINFLVLKGEFKLWRYDHLRIEKIENRIKDNIKNWS